MHVLYFHQHFSTPQGSTGTRSYEMAQALIRAGHKVTMVCGSNAQGQTGLSEPFSNGRRRGSVDGIDVIELALNYTNHMGFAQRVGVFAKFALGSIGIALREPADVVFATTTPLTAGIPGVFARWLRRKPFVFEVRDLWPELPRAMGVITNPIVLGLLSGLEWVCYRSADRLVGLSPGICEGIAKRGVTEERIAMVPNGCDLGVFSADTASGWRPEGVSAAAFMAVFAGTHGIANGLNAVLDAAAELKARGRNDIRFALVGDGKLKSSLRSRAEEEGLDNVVFHEPVDKQRLAGLMSSADIGMQILANVPAFYYGTSPNKFFDYISAGLPVLNNYPGWLADMIDKNNCGYTIPPEDPNAFADALIEAADNCDALTEKGNRALKLAKSDFDRARLAEKWVNWVTGAHPDAIER